MIIHNRYKLTFIIGLLITYNYYAEFHSLLKIGEKTKCMIGFGSAMVQVKMKPYFVSTLGFIFLLNLLGIFQSVHGATKKPYLTKEQHMRYSKILKDELKKKYPSDAEDDGEVVTQESQGFTTVYRLLKEQEDCPPETNIIFRSAGKKEVGKDIIVLLRGQDFFSPTNKERFVVLRQKGGGSEYSVHLATVKRDSRNKMKVNWDTVTISLTKDASPLIELSVKPVLVVGNWGSRKVPRCGWTGNVLLCEARKEPRKIGVTRRKKPTRRRPKPPYGRLPTPMPAFPPPPKRAGRRKIKNPYGIGEEGGPPRPLLPGQDRPLVDPMAGEGGLGLGGPGQGLNKAQNSAKQPGQNKSKKPGAGGRKGGKESSEETFVTHKGTKPPGSLHKEKKQGK